MKRLLVCVAVFCFVGIVAIKALAADRIGGGSGPSGITVFTDGGLYLYFSQDGGVLTVNCLNCSGGAGVGWDAGVLVQNIVWEVLDGGWLNYSYGTPLAVDSSAQTSCTTTDVKCALTETALPSCAGCKRQNIQNNGSLPICIGTIAALSCPAALDAGTTAGQILAGGGFYSFDNDQQVYCVMANSAQVAPDAGTVVIGCK